MPMEPAATSPDNVQYRYRFGHAEFDEVRFELRLAGVPVEIEQRPLQLLAELLRHVGEVLTKDELLERVWAGRPTVENVLANAVAKLRKALGEVEGARIVTLPRVGYRFNGPIERTATGRRLLSRLELGGDREVPGRPNFVLDRQLNPARGSEVWLARHAKTGEPRVFKLCADGEQLAALKREATLYRVLTESLGERDDIVRVLDWNFETAPFFLECEYGGENLKDWAQGGALNALDTEQRIALFLQIATAVAAAHSVGVMHKDLKPANVLITRRAGGWQVRLTDFGSGRLLRADTLDALQITALGMTMTQALDPSSGSGTPLYLAPELVAGHAPTLQSEVYALGLILYQLVTGDLQRPMATGWEQGVDDELLREDIAAATHGDPARRLASVAALIERLGERGARHAARVREREREARLAAAEAQLVRSRARRPWMAGAVTMLAAGLVTALLLNQRAERARDEALRQAALAAEINRFLNEDLLGGGQTRTSTIAYDRNPTLRELIDAARLRLEGRFVDAPQIESALRTTLGRAYRTLGDFRVAEGELRRAVELERGRRPPADPVRLIAEYDLVTVLVRLSRFDEARTRLDEADAAAGPALDEPTELGLRARLARGAYHFQRFEPAPALAAYEAAESARRAARPDDIALAAHIRLTIGDAQLRLKNAPRAEAIARDILAGDPYTEDSVGLSTLATARRLLGHALRNQGRPAEAIPHLQRAVAEQEQVRGPDDQSTIAALSSLGHLHGLTGDAARRVEIQRDVYARSQRRWGAEHQYTLVERLNLGDAEHDAGRPHVARLHLEAAHEGLTRVAGEGSSLVDAARYSLASVLAALDRHEQALALVDRIDSARLARGSADAEGDAKLAALRGRLLLALGRREDGEQHIGRAIALLSEHGTSEEELAPLRALLRAR